MKDKFLQLINENEELRRDFDAFVSRRPDVGVDELATAILYDNFRNSILWLLDSFKCNFSDDVVVMGYKQSLTGVLSVDCDFDHAVRVNDAYETHFVGFESLLEWFPDVSILFEYCKQDDGLCWARLWFDMGFEESIYCLVDSLSYRDISDGIEEIFEIINSKYRYE